MALSVTCPHCMKASTYDDSAAGKEVRCKGCKRPLLLRLATRPLAPAAEEVDDVEIISAEVRGGPPKLPPRLPTEGFRRGARVYDEEEAAAPQGKSTFGLVLGLSIGGGLLLIGVVVVVALFLMKGDESNPGLIAEGPPPNALALQGILDPFNADHFDAMLKHLKSNADDKRDRAISWLNRADPNHPKRPEAAKAMETLVNEYIGKNHLNEPFFTAYFRWTTRDNLPWLIRMVQEKEISDWARTRRHQAMQALGKLKEAAAIPDIANKLDIDQDSIAAFQALREFGAVAEKNVLPYFNHPSSRARNHARQLLQLYGTQPDLLLSQTVKDLNDSDEKRGTAALEYLATVPLNPKRQGEVAQALDNLIVPQARRNHNLMNALRVWAMAANVPKLGLLLKEERLGGEDLIRILAVIPHSSSAEVLAERIGNFFDGKVSQDALVKMGPALAEPPLVKQLANPDRGARLNAVKLLGFVGTKNSLAAIQNAGTTYAMDNEFRNAALASFNTIQQRGQ